MNYYDEVLKQINDLIQNKQYEQAKSIIINELNISYVPRDFENKLKDYLNIIKQETYITKTLSDEEIIEYLKADDMKQLIAVKYLHTKNLREYIDLINDYFKNGSLLDGKLLLIDSLISQEINYEFSIVKNNELLNFNPSKIKPCTESDGFISCNKYLSDVFMQNPSMLKLSQQLLYKECLQYLPLSYSSIDGIKLAEKIEKYIIKAFESAN